MKRGWQDFCDTVWIKRQTSFQEELGKGVTKEQFITNPNAVYDLYEELLEKDIHNQDRYDEALNNKQERSLKQRGSGQRKEKCIANKPSFGGFKK